MSAEHFFLRLCITLLKGKDYDFYVFSSMLVIKHGICSFMIVSVCISIIEI